MNVFELAAKITADSSGLDKGLNTADKSMQDFAGKATKTLNNLKKVFAAVVSVAAVKKIATGSFNLASATSQLGDKIDKQSQALGLSRKAYQEWDYILGQSGASIDSLGTSMKTLNTAILSGGKEANAAFKELGLSTKELSSLTQERAFEKVINAFQRLPSGAQKSALAVKIFGKNGQDLLPLLNSASGSIDELRENAEKLGFIMSDDAIDASVAYGDALDDLKRAYTGIKNTLGAQVLPIFTRGFQIVTNYAGRFSGYVKDAIDTGDWKGLFDNILGDVGDAATRLWTRISDTVPVLWDNAQNALLESDSPILQVIGILMQDITDAIGYVAEHKEEFTAVFNEISTSIGGIVTTGIETVKSVFQWLNENGVETQDAIKGIIAAFAIIKLITIVSKMNSITLLLGLISAGAALIIEHWDGIQEFFTEMWTAISTEVTNAYDAVRDWFVDKYETISQAWQPVSDFFTRIWEEITTSISDAWTNVNNWLDNNTPESIKQAWGTIKGFFVDIWEGITGAIQGTIDKIREFLGLSNSAGGSGGGHSFEVNGTTYADPFGATSGIDPSSYMLDLSSFYNPDNSNANGLSFVPENGYLTELHFGEAVLSRNEAEKWRSGQSGSESGAVDLSAFTSAIVAAVRAGIESANINLDGEVVTRNVNRRMANELKARRFATV